MVFNPNKECNVCPSAFLAATPVGAATTMFFPRARDSLTISPRSLVLPVPALPVMKKLLHKTGLYEPLKKFIINGMPVLATCAGLILLAENIEGDESPCFGTMDISVKRNAYGRQLGSFRCVDKFNGVPIEMPFIRAPYVTKTRNGVDVLSVHDGKVVAVRQKNQLAAAFHPELTRDDTVYKMFKNMF